MTDLCDKSLNLFPPQALKSHLEDCSRLNNCPITMPSTKSAYPLIIYADIESILKPLDEKQKYQEHIPADIGYFVNYSNHNSL